MSEEKKSHLNENHVYDGIVEENNPMPDWWIWLFILTTIFGSIYWLHYASGGGPTLMQEYQAELQQYQEKVKAYANSPIQDSEETLQAYMQAEYVINEGTSIYAEKCAMCHGTELEGRIGPNLTDRYWLTGTGTRQDLIKVIAEGVPSNGMPAWQSMLSRNAIKNVTAFVYSRIGSTPENPKAPQGKEVQ
jgi:cytochrome c oxidase cbb3-type subunit 3